MIRRPPRSTLSSSSAASDVYKRQRWGLYMISAAWPLLVSVLAMSAPDPQIAGLVAVLVLSIAQSAACIALLRDAVTARLGGPRPDRRTVIAAVALTAVGTLTAAWAFPIAAESGSTRLPIAGAFWTALLAAAAGANPHPVDPGRGDRRDRLRRGRSWPGIDSCGRGVFRRRRGLLRHHLPHVGVDAVAGLGNRRCPRGAGEAG